MMSTMAGRRTVVSEVGPCTPEKASDERRLEPTVSGQSGPLVEERQMAPVLSLGRT